MQVFIYSYSNCFKGLLLYEFWWFLTTFLGRAAPKIKAILVHMFVLGVRPGRPGEWFAVC